MTRSGCTVNCILQVFASNHLAASKSLRDQPLPQQHQVQFPPADAGCHGLVTTGVFKGLHVSYAPTHTETRILNNALGSADQTTTSSVVNQIKEIESKMIGPRRKVFPRGPHRKTQEWWKNCCFGERWALEMSSSFTLALPRSSLLKHTPKASFLNRQPTRDGVT